MNRRLLVLTLALFCTLLSVAGTASAIVIDLALVSPAHHGEITDPIITFTWTGPGGAVKHILTLKSADGMQKVNITVEGITCEAGYCSLQFYPPAHGWVWRNGEAYIWSVKLKENGVVIDKTPKAAFRASLMPSISTFSPQHNTTIAGNSVAYFQWSESAQIDQYKIVLTSGGQTMSSGWLDRTAVCQASCIHGLGFGEHFDGTYKWKVVGRRNYVSGTVKSDKRTLTVQ